MKIPTQFVLLTLGAASIAALFTGVWFGLNAYVAPATPSEHKDLFLVFVQTLGGTALLAGGYLTLRRVRVAEESQITERFTRAIDQIASIHLQVRLAGIFALERIARDSERDHWPVMEVLTAFVRDRAPFSNETVEDHAFDGGELTPGPATDIQAILTVIRRRNRWMRHGEEQRLDLSYTNLSGARLNGSHLEGAYFIGANLERANLEGCRLEDAHFRHAILVSANLIDTRLDRANLLSANLQDAKLARAHLMGANFEDANLEGAILLDARLNRADLRKALGLTRAQIKQARNDGAYLPNYLSETPPDSND